MESSLMALEPESIDDELINTIFRCIHAIKGGSANFGFMQILNFTYVIETLLNDVRAHFRVVDKQIIDYFLQYLHIE